jgi:hypothetical protein
MAPEWRSSKLMSHRALELGGILREAHAKLARGRTGTFNRWITDVLGFSHQQGYRFMYAAEVFGGFSNKLLENYADTAMFVLAAPSAPEEARKAALVIAEAGKRVTYTKAKELVATYGDDDEEEEFQLFDALMTWRRVIDREYAKFPAKWQGEFIQETGKILEELTTENAT